MRPYNMNSMQDRIRYAKHAGLFLTVLLSIPILLAAFLYAEEIGRFISASMGLSF